MGPRAGTGFSWKRISVPHYGFRNPDSPARSLAPRLLLDRILSHLNFMRFLIPYIPKVHFNIITPYTPGSVKYSLPFTFLDSNVPLCATRHHHLMLLDFIALLSGDEYKLWSISLDELKYKLRLVVTLSTTYFNTKNVYILHTKCIYVFFMYLRMKWDSYPIKHYLMGALQAKRCLLRGMNWMFKYKSS